MESFKTVLTATENGVLTLTMNRPQKRNALDAALNADLLAAFIAAEADDAVRAIVLTGAGKGFCAGADLAVFGANPTPDQVYQAIIDTYQPLMGKLATMEKPIIAAINGAAAGAGAALALACDLQVMADDASLMMAFSNIGLVPDAGASWFLVRQVGYGRAFQIAAEGEPLPAATCLDWGLANKVVPAGQLLEITQAWAGRLARRPTVALGLTKHVLNFSMQHFLAASIEYEARLQKRTITTADHREGVQAFLEKRPPRFTGK